MRRSALLTLLPIIAVFINVSLAPLEMLMPKRMTELGAGAAGLAGVGGVLLVLALTGTAEQRYTLAFLLGLILAG